MDNGTGRKAAKTRKKNTNILRIRQAIDMQPHGSVEITSTTKKHATL